jgi:hypothetical protein
MIRACVRRSPIKTTQIHANQSDVVTKYKAAADVCNKALAAVVDACKPGARVVDLCELGDATVAKCVLSLFVYLLLLCEGYCCWQGLYLQHTCRHL